MRVAEVPTTRSICVPPSLRTAGADALLDVFVQAMEVGGAGRSVRRKISCRRSAPSGFENAWHAVVFAEDDFGAAAADIDHQEAFCRMRPPALHAEMNEAGFFLAGDDFDRAQRVGSPCDKSC